MTRAAAALLAAVVLTGCGGAKDARRSDVNDYITTVNKVERDAVVPWSQARSAFIALGHGAITNRQVRELATAPKTIRSLRTRIAAVKPPEDARRLRVALLRLFDLNARFAAEVGLFARYVRAARPLEKQLGAYTAQLRLALKHSHASNAEQRTLSTYATRVGELLGLLGRLHPPPALAPWHAEQTARLVTLRGGARELTDGLARHDQALATRGLVALTGAAATSAVTVADRGAVLAYNARLRQISAAAAAVAREQNRLARALA